MRMLILILILLLGDALLLYGYCNAVTKSAMDAKQDLPIWRDAYYEPL